jgi:hypothetical protein
VTKCRIVILFLSIDNPIALFCAVWLSGDCWWFEGDTIPFKWGKLPGAKLVFFKMMLQLSNISKQVIHELSLQSRLDLGRMRVNLAFMVLSASVFNLQARRA